MFTGFEINQVGAYINDLEEEPFVVLRLFTGDGTHCLSEGLSVEDAKEIGGNLIALAVECESRE